MERHPAIVGLLDAAERGGIPISRLHKHLGCARATVYLWANGVQPTDQYMGNIRGLTTQLNKAVDKQLLPLNVDETISKLLESLSV